VKALILAEPIDELVPFVPEVLPASPAEKWRISRATDRISRQAMRDYWNRPRRLLQEMSMDSGTLIQGSSLHANLSFN
jgi:hypothetical protein